MIICVRRFKPVIDRVTPKDILEILTLFSGTRSGNSLALVNRTHN